MTTSIIERLSGPNLLARFLRWLFIGWWASGITAVLVGLALTPIVAGRMPLVASLCLC